MSDRIVMEAIAIEWEMFTGVKSFGGKAQCQEDWETFTIMRASQLEAWSDELMHSYCNDLMQAKSGKRNLMTEKYARMMEHAFPEEYRALADRLPCVDDKTLEVIEKIVAIHLSWKNEILIKYPKLSGRGRPVSTKDDSRFATSFETYLRGELSTYSARTVQLYYDMVLKCLHEDDNLEMLYLSNIVRKYGYSSIDQAEERA